jgi:hypothetical protein
MFDYGKNLVVHVVGHERVVHDVAVVGHAPFVQLAEVEAGQLLEQRLDPVVDEHALKVGALKLGGCRCGGR